MASNTMYWQVIGASKGDDNEAKRLIQQEMELSLKCKVCGNVFHSLDLCLTHKMIYCMERAGNALAICPDPSAHGIQTETQAQKTGRKGNAKSVQETSSKSATGAARQKSRMSARERKPPKRMMDLEEEAEVKPTPGGRKRPAPTDSAEEGNGRDASTKRHSEVQNSQRLPCNECGETFANKKSLTVHVTHQHGGPITTSDCPLCHKPYRYTSGLARHMKNAHHMSGDDIRKVLRARRTPASNRVVSAAERSAGPSAALAKTDGSSSNVEPARAVGPEAAEKTVSCPVLVSASLRECKSCALQFKQEASYKKHIKLCHPDELSPHSKKTWDLITLVDRVRERVAPETAKILSDPGHGSLPMYQHLHISPGKPTLPGGLSSGKTSEVGDAGVTHRGKFAGADGPQSGLVMLKTKEALPSAPNEYFVVEPGRKLELVRIDRQPSKPSQKGDKGVMQGAGTCQSSPANRTCITPSSSSSTSSSLPTSTITAPVPAPQPPQSPPASAPPTPAPTPGSTDSQGHSW